jgi:hypothetical protein
MIKSGTISTRTSSGEPGIYRQFLSSPATFERAYGFAVQNWWRIGFSFSSRKVCEENGDRDIGLVASSPIQQAEAITFFSVTRVTFGDSLPDPAADTEAFAVQVCANAAFTTGPLRSCQYALLHCDHHLSDPTLSHAYGAGVRIRQTQGRVSDSVPNAEIVEVAVRYSDLDIVVGLEMRALVDISRGSLIICSSSRNRRRTLHVDIYMSQFLFATGLSDQEVKNWCKKDEFPRQAWLGTFGHLFDVRPIPGKGLGLFPQAGRGTLPVGTVTHYSGLLCVNEPIGKRRLGDTGFSSREGDEKGKGVPLTPSHVLSLNDGWCVDGLSTPIIGAGVGSFANHSLCGFNAEFVTLPAKKLAGSYSALLFSAVHPDVTVDSPLVQSKFLRLLRDVKEGEEITVRYFGREEAFQRDHDQRLQQALEIVRRFGCATGMNQSDLVHRLASRLNTKRSDNNFDHGWSDKEGDALSSGLNTSGRSFEDISAWLSTIFDRPPLLISSLSTNKPPYTNVRNVDALYKMLLDNPGLFVETWNRSDTSTVLKNFAPANVLQSRGFNLLACSANATSTVQYSAAGRVVASAAGSRFIVLSAFPVVSRTPTADLAAVSRVRMENALQSVRREDYSPAPCLYLAPSVLRDIDRGLWTAVPMPHGHIVDVLPPLQLKSSWREDLGDCLQLPNLPQYVAPMEDQATATVSRFINAALFGDGKRLDANVEFGYRFVDKSKPHGDPLNIRPHVITTRSVPRASELFVSSYGHSYVKAKKLQTQPLHTQTLFAPGIDHEGLDDQHLRMLHLAEPSFLADVIGSAIKVDFDSALLNPSFSISVVEPGRVAVVPPNSFFRVISFLDSSSNIPQFGFSFPWYPLDSKELLQKSRQLSCRFLSAAQNESSVFPRGFFGLLNCMLESHVDEVKKFVFSCDPRSWNLAMNAVIARNQLVFRTIDAPARDTPKDDDDLRLRSSKTRVVGSKDVTEHTAVALVTAPQEKATRIHLNFVGEDPKIRKTPLHAAAVPETLSTAPLSNFPKRLDILTCMNKVSCMCSGMRDERISLNDAEVSILTWIVEQSGLVPEDTLLISGDILDMLCDFESPHNREKATVLIVNSSSLSSGTKIRYFSGITRQENHFLHIAADIQTGNVFIGDSLAQVAMSAKTRVAAQSVCEMLKRVQQRLQVKPTSPPPHVVLHTCSPSQTPYFCGHAAYMFRAIIFWSPGRCMSTVFRMKEVEESLVAVLGPVLLSALKQLYGQSKAPTLDACLPAVRQVTDVMRSLVDGFVRSCAVGVVKSAEVPDDGQISNTEIVKASPVFGNEEHRKLTLSNLRDGESEEKHPPTHSSVSDQITTDDASALV